MPFEKFQVYLDDKGKVSTETTFRAWAKRLEYLFAHLNDDNIFGYTPGTDEIKDFMIDFGLGTGQVNAADIPLTDSPAYYTSTSIEGALQEIGDRLYNYLDVSATTGAGDSTANLPIPFSGKRMAIYCSAANSSDRAIVYSGSTAIFIGSDNHLRIIFDHAGETADLIGVSTARWGILSLGMSFILETNMPILST